MTIGRRGLNTKLDEIKWFIWLEWNQFKLKLNLILDIWTFNYSEPSSKLKSH